MGKQSIIKAKGVGRLALTVSIFFSLFIAQQVFAIDPADVNAATGATQATESQSAAWQWMLAFAVGMFVGRKILGMFGR
ncbi:hypothetical protein [Acinetobacter haemolyticus]|uniref:hypothetical protein n=1 Tax=Acinetobacter haemolyticus TaxID=29430 RepID=UPI0021CD1EB9|nr:hypothetical protein [Acinetobacter haemolyticus]MCU4380019.1 hypothetical protein [Acinetobacter haemolyticus]